MTSIGKTEQTLPDASAPLSTGAVAVGLAGTALGLLAVACDYREASAFFAWAAMAGLSGIATALLERGTRRARVCLGLASALLVGNLLVSWFASDVRSMRLIFAVVFFALVALIPSWLAWRVSRKGMSVYTYLLTLWLAPAVLLPTLGAGIDFLEHGQFNAENSIGFCLSLPFGPWATQFARVLSFPNAGEFFHLPTALAFTVVLGTVVGLILSRPRTAAYWLVPFAWLLIGWFTVGYVQLVNCLF